MKMRKVIGTITVGSSLAIALAAGLWLPVQTQAADQVKGAEKLMQLNRITTPAQAEALKPGAPETVTVRIWDEVEVLLSDGGLGVEGREMWWHATITGCGRSSVRARR